MKFNEKLVMLRKQHGYSQEQLAEKVGVSRQAVSRWETGDTTPELALLVRLCEVFEVRADDLIRDDLEVNAALPTHPAERVETPPPEQKKDVKVLISAVCFVFAAFCSLMALITSTSDMQRALSCVNETILVALAVVQFRRYFKGR